jgi:mannitol/fructose-specific phosphotransferase system IIA component (Ntr-type)
MLKVRLSNEFPSIIIKKVCSMGELSEVDDMDIDFIISTTPLSIRVKIPVIYVSPLLNKQDVNEIKKLIYNFNLKSKNKQEWIIEDIMAIILQECYVKDYSKLYRRIAECFTKEDRLDSKQPMLSELALPQHICLRVKADNCIDVARYGGEILYNTGCVEERFIEAIISSKALLGTNVVIAPRIALLHTKPSNGVKKLSMSFITLEKPVVFGNDEYDPVSFVLTLAASDNSMHLKALSTLVELMDDIETLKKLIEANDVKDFIQVLVNFETCAELTENNN